MTFPLHGLYAITDPMLIPDQRLLPTAEAALRGGARLLQYRDKPASAMQRLERAGRLAELCRQYGALFIVNDDPALAQAVNADGVHMGQSDGAVPAARALLGANKIIGVSCHGDLALAAKGAAEGADYLALGRFYPSHTKPEAPPVTLDTLREARDRFAQPLVAIGGITTDNAQPLIDAGANMIALIHGLFATADYGEIEVRARQLSRLFPVH
ncbi:Thiamine-phosphate pyrophosphorylase [Alloalcanivorax dieselolei B5]|uniref:Thiamine-phosphate synthase n=1 Tax=Alcanivorax dieselolei (strain DSM 16502 / CGMCC 1.3690 / MCCC 1A00001 / B-5) TaxID=930169 RepID=K0CEQ9_ALCDB|nr:thiamine phosphate synthase [Alloalcanivorax dieselolei]AFT72089.1 Thiamine-phosphate pyrophosphorylase [Alloalcanivorax dieselolei B5]GGJ75082.1 thiamine-phosphate synthase [Alloalcanivorax dieselolei]